MSKGLLTIRLGSFTCEHNLFRETCEKVAASQEVQDQVQLALRLPSKITFKQVQTHPMKVESVLVIFF